MAVPQTSNWTCKVYLRPGDRFDIGEGYLSTFELQLQDRVEVTSSLPDASGPRQPEHDQVRLDHIGACVLNAISDEEEMPRNSTDVLQSFVASGQSRSPTAPLRNLFESVEETPHVASRFHPKEAGSQDFQPGLSPSTRAIEPETSTRLSLNSEIGDSSTRMLKPSDDVARADATSKSSVQVLHESSEETYRLHQDHSMDGLGKLIDKVQSEEDPETGSEPDDVDPSGNTKLLERASSTAAPTLERASHGTHKRKAEASIDSPFPPTKRSKPDDDESQNSVDSIIDVAFDATRIHLPSNSRTSFTKPSIDNHPQSFQAKDDRSFGIQDTNAAFGEGSSEPVTYSAPEDELVQEDGGLRSPNMNKYGSLRGPRDAETTERAEKEVDPSLQDGESSAEITTSRSSTQSNIVMAKSSQTSKSRDEHQRSSSGTLTPGSSGRSASPDDSTTRSPYKGKPLKVVFSSNSRFVENVSFKQFLRRQGSSVGHHVTDKSSILCIGRGEIRKSASLLLAVAFGKMIVTDRWASKSLKAGHLLDPAAFLPSDPSREEEWKFQMSEISGHPREDVFAGKTLYVTPTLKKEYRDSGFKEIEEIVRACGAASVISRPAKDFPEDQTIIILVSKYKDPDASVLQKDGRPCFYKDLLSMSVLRGSLQLQSDEFRVHAGGKRQGKIRNRKTA